MHRCKLFSAGFCISYSSLGGCCKSCSSQVGKYPNKKDIKYTNPVFGHQWTGQSMPLYQGCQSVYYIHHLTSSWPPSRPSRIGLLFLRSCLARAAARGPGDTSHDSCCQVPLSVLHSDWHPHRCWVLLSFPPWEHLPCATPHPHHHPLCSSAGRMLLHLTANIRSLSGWRLHFPCKETPLIPAFPDLI